MNQFLEQYWWLFACGSSYCFGMATVILSRIAKGIREDRQRPQEQVDMECGYGYSAQKDTTRILQGIREPRLPVPISPSPLAAMYDPSGGYATIGIKHLNVDQRYQTLQWLNRPQTQQWTRVVAPVSPAPTLYEATVMRQHGAHAAVEVGKHRLKKGVPVQIQALTTPTQEIDLNEVWKRINDEERWEDGRQADTRQQIPAYR